MDGKRRVYTNEIHPLYTSASLTDLRSSGPTIYLNTAKTKKNKSHEDCTVIHLNSEKKKDFGLYLNTTFSITSSKKIKLLFVLNFLLSLVCILICFSSACYYWHELSALRRQIDMMKDHLIIQNLSQDKTVQSPLVLRHHSPQEEGIPQLQALQNHKKFVMDNLGNNLEFDSQKRNDSEGNKTIKHIETTSVLKDVLIAQFNGAFKEHNIGSQYIVGPWTRDEDVSSKNSHEKIELSQDHVVIKENGLYLVYAQMVYVSHAPSCYMLWAHERGRAPTLLALCSAGGAGGGGALGRSQASCSVQTVARLRRGVTVNLSLRNANRTVLGGPGYTYFGFVKLSP